MFRSLFITLLFVGATAAADSAREGPSLAETSFAPFLTAQAFTCSGKTCPQMSSCEEACHALLVCGDRRRDGDGDGIPCETLCSRPCR